MSEMARNLRARDLRAESALNFVSVPVLKWRPSWWYLRNIRLVGSIVWIDGAPEQPMSAATVVRQVLKVKWLPAVHSVIGSHIWFGNWSFLSVRSWIYQVFECLIVVAAGGLLIVFIRKGKGQVNIVPIDRRGLLVNVVVYGAFLVSIAYHVLMSLINFGIAASTGWYLYAVIVPEAILITAGLLVFRWGRQILTGLILCLLMREMYATHWLLVAVLQV